MRKIAINRAMHAKEKVIINKGFIILGSMDDDESLLILAGWCKVFHQSTENFIIGKFIEQRIINTAVIFSPISLFK